MQSIVLYFNELCFESNSPRIYQEHHWIAAIDELSLVIESVLKIRPDCNISFPLDSWFADCAGNALSERFRKRLSRDRYRRLLLRIKKIADENGPLLREVHFLQNAALGLTLADVAASAWTHGWAVSLPFSNSPWLQHTVAAERFVLNDQGILDGPIQCDVSHMSCVKHVEQWEIDIRDWGATIAPSCELAMLNEHPIVMYLGPREHGPAHVHLLVSRGSRETLAKYEINQFNRCKGRPDWDVAMRDWIAEHRDQLLRSWDRCQLGGFPYAIG